MLAARVRSRLTCVRNNIAQQDKEELELQMCMKMIVRQYPSPNDEKDYDDEVEEGRRGVGEDRVLLVGVDGCTARRCGREQNVSG